MQFSIVIPTYKRPEALLNCIRYLDPSCQNYPASDYELIVSDDAADFSLKEVLSRQFPWVQWVAGPGRGPAANRNNGAKAAKASWIVFLDDDCTPSTDLLTAYQAVLNESSFAPLVLEGAILKERPRQTLAEHAPLNESGGRLWSCNLAIEKAFFEEIGGFDEAFPYAAYEDIDFLKRIQKAGIHPVFVEKAAVTHPWVLRHVWPYFLAQRKSALIYLKKHPEESTSMSPWMLFKILLGRFYTQTIPCLWRYRGKGFLFSLAFDFLEVFFIGYLFYRSLFKKCYLLNS